MFQLLLSEDREEVKRRNCKDDEEPVSQSSTFIEPEDASRRSAAQTSQSYNDVTFLKKYRWLLTDSVWMFSFCFSAGSSVRLRERGADQQEDQKHLGLRQENQKLGSLHRVSTTQLPQTP